jgi:phosphoserine phosphatase
MAIRIVFFDCDGTLTKVKSSWEYIHRRFNIWDNHADEYQMLFREGKINYDEFCRRDALLWKGLNLTDIAEIIKEIPYQEGAAETVATLRGMGIFTVILSTGLSFLVNRVRDDLGIHMSLSNDLLVKDGVLTGGTAINVQYNKKGYWVNKFLKEKGLDRLASCAIGDGEGDRDMFDAVSLSIMYGSDKNVAPSSVCTIHEGSLTRVVEIIKNHSGDNEA